MPASLTVVPVIPLQMLFPGDSSPVERWRPRVASYVQASRADNTRRGYLADFRHFSGWCQQHGLESLPAAPETVASYLTACADSGTLKAGSIQRRVSAISNYHQAAGLESPTATAVCRLTLAGIRHKLGTRQEGKAAVLTSDLAAMCSHMPAGLKGLRDRALLLVGFAGAFRRSELCGIDVEHLTFTADGVRILVPRSKTDQAGTGREVGIVRGTTALCPVAALEAWLQASGITTGPVFRSVSRHSQIQTDRLGDRSVALVVKEYAAAAGLDAAKCAGHSLRVGLVTQAVVNSVDLPAIQRQTGHRSLDMLLKYSRSANLFRDNASAQLGL